MGGLILRAHTPLSLFKADLVLPRLVLQVSLTPKIVERHNKHHVW